MEGLKNMIVIKNIPSNIIEQAFIVVNSNLKIDKLELSDSKRPQNSKYIIKEAEDVINSCTEIIDKFY